MLGDTQHDPSYCVPRVLQQPQRSDQCDGCVHHRHRPRRDHICITAATQCCLPHEYDPPRPILPLSPTHLEFHPLLETAPVRIPWDRGPFLVNIDCPVVKRDTTKRAHITTTDSQTPTTIDITCLDLTYAQLQRLIGCFACRPQYRGVLATDGGVTLVRTLIDDKPTGWPA